MLEFLRIRGDAMSPTDYLRVSTLENWLWEAACKIRGDIDAPKYKDYILPLIFLKRLSDVFEDEIKRLGKEFVDVAKVISFSLEVRAYGRLNEELQ